MNLEDGTVAQVTAQVRSKALDPVTYREVLSDRAARQAALNAYVHTGPPDVPETPAATEGALAGALLAVKDNIDVAGTPTTAGTPALADHVPGLSSTVWLRCARAGARLAGKTALHELAYGITGHHALGPPALNPSAPGHLAGGSSSGTAAAVAARLAPAGLGTDTGGSVRIPAALCGIVGYRPTKGRYPMDGVVRVSTTRDTVGVLARDVRDVRILDRVLADLPPGTISGSPLPEPPRALLPTPMWEDLDAEVERVCRLACDRLRAAGWQLLPCHLPEFCWRDVLHNATLVPFFETREALEGYLVHHAGAPDANAVMRAVAGEDVRAHLLPQLSGAGPHPSAYAASLRDAALLTNRLRSVLDQESAQLLLSPATVLPAPERDVGTTLSGPSGDASTFLTYIRNTSVAAVTGSPSVTVPAGSTAAGLPVGLLLDARPGADLTVLACAEEAHRLLVRRIGE
ncbi:amidase family protein [Streptomyces sp. NPDC052077]|uniref:amidase family protein n=1 Tax=Streptomyces sp. NPDC052077 TaxID=3154757 RepID=UPI00342310B6